MADPFSIAGSAVGVVSLGIKVCEDLVKFLGHVRDGKSEVARISNSLDQLADILEELQSVVNTAKQASGNTVLGADRGIAACAVALEELRHKLPQTTTNGTKGGFLGHIRLWRKNLSFPFKRDEILFLKDMVEGFQQNLTVALQAFQPVQNQHHHHRTNEALVSLV